MDSEGKSDDAGSLQTARTSSPYLTPAESLMEKEQSVDFLSIPFESRFSESSHNPPLPPLQSLTEDMQQKLFVLLMRWMEHCPMEWTLIRGVSADHVIEWEEKFWEAADKFQYKELGSEKSGRDATGNVWREYWKESMWQDCGLMHMEKTADKWGKNGKGDEWHEKWWEQYDASGKADKWAHKWCSMIQTHNLRLVMLMFGMKVPIYYLAFKPH
ncbi:hypothetical protein CK203_102830 [Vitis vinifera]|uniref:Uncharacterized protein n=1 Tax=Vitis vinifera TaxID=29760 RepID=A0A438F6G5_VITVI|nr:hypothetical protein CK203_102830 [Vitis vinifera]